MNQAITSLFSGGGGLDLGFHGNFEYLTKNLKN
jgi:site-specific DNA-cytosine methylase